MNSTLSQAPKFVIVKPGINIQQQVKPNIVVMNPPTSNTQVYNIQLVTDLAYIGSLKHFSVFVFFFPATDDNAIC